MGQADGEAKHQADHRQADHAEVVERSDGELLQIEGEEDPEQEPADGAEHGPAAPHATTFFPKAAPTTPMPVRTVAPSAPAPIGVLSGLLSNFT
jgi:hypothetical protein